MFPVFAVTESAAMDNPECRSFHKFGSYIGGRLLELSFLGQKEKAQTLLLDISKPSSVEIRPF